MSTAMKFLRIMTAIALALLVTGLAVAQTPTPKAIDGKWRVTRVISYNLHSL